jgi:hypothetical protein
VINDGIYWRGRFSVGWNFHPSRKVRTIALPLAISFAADRFLLTLGPLTFIWLKGNTWISN